MAFLGISSSGGGVSCVEWPGWPVEAGLVRALAGVPRAAPVVILVHGFRYHPASAEADPFVRLYGPGEANWPGGLGFSRRDPHNGLCIGFGWEGVAMPGRRRWRHLSGFAQIYGRAGGTGRRLASVINAIGAIDPQRRVDVLAHSLGARVALRALPALQQANLGRVILLGAAEYEGEALRMLQANAANRQAEFINVTARANDPVDYLFERLAPRRLRDDCALGAGRRGKGLRWLDVPIDNPAAIACLSRRGIEICPRRRMMDHGGFYLRDGVFDFYQALIRNREDMALALLRFELSFVPDEPRWTRLVPRHWGGLGAG